MATEIIMPQMGFDMKEGTVVRWIKSEGEPVGKGEMVAEIETDKAVVEIESYDSGILRKVYIAEGTTVPVGQVIGIIGSADEEIPEVAPPPHAIAEPAPEAPPTSPGPAAAPAAASVGTGERTKASPLARKTAEERSIDLAQVPGTGPAGRITRKDVLAFSERAAVAAPPAIAPAPPAAAAPAAATAAPGEVVPLSRMRQAIARSMSRSKQEIPHFYVVVAIDMTDAVRLRRQLNSLLPGDERISINDMIIKACAMAIVKHRMFNASYTDAGIQVHQRVNIGMAIALDAGLIAPGILDCDRKSLAEIARESKALAERARAGKLSAQEYTGATFNVTNLGMYRVESFSAIITPPQAAALAVGTVQQEPVVRNGEVVIADVMRVTLSIDHRVADGAQGAIFVGEVRRLLETPVGLLI